MSNYRKYSDEQLASLLSEGDKAAFTAIYERYWHTLWIFVVKALRVEEDARDLIQDVFSTIWEKHENIRIHTSLKAFLYKTTLHQVIKQVEKTRNATAFYERMHLHLASHPGPFESPAEFGLLEKELIIRFEKVVANMPPKMREAYIASRSEELGYQQIADRMGISRESVKTHIKHALKMLRKQLNSMFVTFF